MLASIHPLGERSRGNRFWITAALHAVGAAAGGAAAGAFAGTAGWGLVEAGVSPRALTIAGLAIAVGFTVLEATGRVGLVPHWRRQVNERWFDDYRRWIYAVGYGLQLGAGVVTIVTSTTVYMVLVLAAITGSPLWGAVVGTVFGLVRGASLVTVAGVDRPERLIAFHRDFQRRERSARAAAVAGLVATAAVLAGAAVLT
jgi:hypothetical protein